MKDSDLKGRGMKFRVWNKTEKRFVEPAPGKKILVDGEGRLYAHLKLPTSDKVAEVKHYEVDRWTGLQDTHGREIYENDIVIWGHHCPDCRENPTRIAVVKIDPDITFWELRMDHPFRYGSFGYQDTSHLEVVGNVRENPEVLKDPDAFLNKVFRPLDRFLVFPKSEKGKVGGFLLYEGKNFVAYGYGNGKSAKPFYEKAIPLSMEVFKRLLEIETSNFAQPNLIDAGAIYTTAEEETVSLQQVEKIEALPDDGTLVESTMTIQRMGTLKYKQPYFQFPNYMEKGARRYGLARLFLENLDKVWRKDHEKEKALCS